VTCLLQRPLLDSTRQTQKTNVHALIGFENAVLAIERSQSYIIGRTATGIVYRKVAKSVCPSIFMGKLGSHRTDFREIWYLNNFRKSLKNVKFHWSGTRIAVVYMKTDTHFWSCLAQFFLEWEMFQIKVVGEIKTQILYSVTLFRKLCRIRDNVGKT